MRKLKKTRGASDLIWTRHDREVTSSKVQVSNACDAYKLQTKTQNFDHGFLHIAFSLSVILLEWEGTWGAL